MNARAHDQVEQFQINRDQGRDNKVKIKMQVKHGQGKAYDQVESRRRC